jgi:hypothetical protein
LLFCCFYLLYVVVQHGGDYLVAVDSCQLAITANFASR